MKEIAIKFYDDLFGSKEVENMEFISGHFPQISDDLQQVVASNFTVTDTKKAFYQIGS